MIYLDYNATAPYSKSVQKYIQNNMANDWANPSSEHDAGFSLSRKIDQARLVIADYLTCSSKSLLFTGSATESINTILSPDFLNKHGIKNIVTSKMEHHATLDRSKKISNVIFIDNDKDGVIDLSHLEEILKMNDNCIVSLLLVNNETGVINPITEISKITRKFGALIHIDAVQALGKININLEELGVDFASFAGHKIGALKGVGLLYASEIKDIVPLMNGGGQERGYRPSTSNFAAIESFKLAVEDIDLNICNNRIEVRDYLEEQLLECSNVSINCKNANRVYNTSNVFIEGIDAKAVMLQLSRKNIMISTGSACSSGSIGPSHVVLALGFAEEYATSSLRISFGVTTTLEEIDIFLNSIKEIINNLR